MRRAALLYAATCVVIVAPAAAFQPLLSSTARLASRQGLCAVRASSDGDGDGGVGDFLKKGGVGGWVQRQLDENMGKVTSMQQGVRGDGVEVIVQCLRQGRTSPRGYVVLQLGQA